MEQSTKPIERACKIIGSASALAARIGVTPQFVSQLRKGAPIPPALCPLIELATRERGEAVLCEELRSDVRWDVVRGSCVTSALIPPEKKADLLPSETLAQEQRSSEDRRKGNRRQGERRAQA